LNRVCTGDLADFCLAPANPEEAGGPQKLVLTQSNIQALLTHLRLLQPEKAEAPKRGYRFGDLTWGTIKAIDKALEKALVYYSPSDLELVVSYMPFTKKSKAELAAELSQSLRAQGLVSSERAGNGEYTWYKLVEWMQVELLSIFSDSLDETPWYRFPFMASMRTYFEVLIEEAKIVHKKMGVEKAVASTAFATDLVPGFVMSGIFAQLALLAAPLRMVLSESYDESKLVEELVIAVSGDGPGVSVGQWQAVDPRIKDVRQVAPSIFAMLVPTFKGLTEVLGALAATKLKGHHFTLVTVSTHVEVQVRVALSLAGGKTVESLDPLLQELDVHPGYAVKFKYAFPSEREKRFMAAIEVQVPYLLDFFRFCAATDGVELMQVYDFYS